nr:hypothetical protein [Oscillospiraceae bacterium]
MKKTTKVLLLLLCAVMLVAGSVMGTLAFLTSQDAVTNTFTVGNVKIELDEAKVGEDGRYTDHSIRVKANDYHLLPGMTYDKDPTVTVKQPSDKAYIRMLVKVANINNLMTVFDDPSYYGADGVFLLQNLISGWDPTIWVFEGRTFEGTTGVYEFRYFAPVDAKNGDVVLDDLFETITIPGEEVTSDNIGLLDAVQIDVVAQAIQEAGFANADAAWAAFN